MKKGDFKKLDFEPDKYWAMAAMYASDARVLHGRRPNAPSIPCYYLYCHSMELAFKGFLRHQGVKSRELATEYGHDLHKLLADCCKSGLQVPGRDPDSDARLVDQLNTYYNDKQFEYMELGGWCLPQMSGVSEYVHALLGHVR